MKRTLFTFLFVTLLAALLPTCSGPAQAEAIPAVAPSQSMPPPADLRDYRYCEIIPVFQNKLTFSVEVYNTMGSNDCPEEQWAKLNGDDLAQQYGAMAVKMNGPRYWVLNKIVAGGATASGKIVDFGGLEMKLVAQIETKLWEGSVGDKFYTPNDVQRATTFVYLKGNMVYELTSPEGDVYRMQSYALLADPTLTIADLETLGARLELPQGWAYQARVLTEDSELKADGLAYVINDNLYNSYQKVTP